GVDKKDVKLVIHYDISDSLENYVQEAGRAGRDQSLQAECYVLFNDNDLDKHFILLNQTKLSISEIQQVWKAIKDLTKTRTRVCCSPLEIARQAGWDDAPGSDIEVRVRTAVAALENAGYVKRGKNVPHVYATSILAENMREASDIINDSALYDDKQRENALRIVKSLISSRSIAEAGNDDAESRVDYLADILGLQKEDVINAITLMREDGLLEDSRDMSAYIRRADSQNKSTQIFERFARLEGFMIDELEEGKLCSGLKEQKELNERAMAAGIAHSSAKNIRTILYYWTIKSYIQKAAADGESGSEVIPLMSVELLRRKYELRADICRFLVEELYRLAEDKPDDGSEEVLAEFSLIGLWKAYCDRPRFDFIQEEPSVHDVEDAILYLSKIGALTLEGGFLVLYSGMEIKRIVTDNKICYKRKDYRMLDEFYKQKIQQIHIVGEYAHLMVRDYDAALQFVQDYFQMDFKQFIMKYFKGERAAEIVRNITPEKYKQLFAELSETQRQIINDDKSKCIVIAAGPGSGKTKVLVHKLASLLLLEEVKHEQLLMVTFSRAAATEFKKRLMELIGNAAGYVEIKTFHSYCFDLLGRIGSLEGAEDVVKNATEMIYNGEAELGRITKTVVVIDEAQDMDENEFALIEALMSRNDDMRVIAVGDDDQNIYEFRGSDSKYLRSFITKHGAVTYEMPDNYRSAPNIVELANAFAASITNRMKSIPCRAVSCDNGTVRLTRHIGGNLEEPIVREIISSKHDGRACVLTNTNEEALRVLGLLNMYGVRAKLIQSNDGFWMYNLAEIRFFLKQIDKKLQYSKIPDEVWNAAKQSLFVRYKSSACLENCKNLILDFETVNPNKYRSDLEEFIKESNYEDFYGDDKESVIVSTIHKAKGREFDAVYMLMNDIDIDSDEMKRRIYVGMTRARKELYIHYNNAVFDNFTASGAERRYDNNSYAAPKEIILQMGHKDVALGFFKGKKELIFQLQSGSPLGIDGSYLTAEIDSHTVRVVKQSKACAERLNILSKKGYKPYKARVRFIVAWKDKDDNEESAVILPEIYLKVEYDR
ncbi:MAG: AAA family ATPase, partial [Butyrivibrio sp.]|nr:AAA family ATPase [Butyrivibrio sp.]